MKNFQQTVNEIQTDSTIQVVYETGKLQQVSRNRLKQALVGALCEDIKGVEGIEVYDIEKGIGVAITTVNEMKLSFVIDITMKDMDAPFEEYAQEYAAKRQQKDERKQEIEEKKAIKLAKDNAKRDKKRAERAEKERRKALKEKENDARD